ncbi:MAG: 4'-phosphopantetheinyl transferase superfamily protein [Streptosporangiales bacterium]|nr:4'-phosphopantetheinyl transferase superfamily protein [Streptosporangiales bacterium]MBO0889844.1 4'-phosphopantetheinyl transferase superfamily protein [Acidothermales bacterium]
MAVDVWVLAVARLVRDGTLARLERVLSADERDRLPAFRVEADRLGYLAAHGLVRHALSARAPSVAPGAWTFRTGPRGRPEVDEPEAHRGLRFNLSHTHGTVACVVTDGIPCGIDVERSDAAADVDLLAGGVLSAAERGRLDGLAGAARRAEFFRYWTLKEAYAKARGDGVVLPLSACEFDPSAVPVRARLAPSLADDERAWWFEQWDEDDCVVALALRHGAAAVPPVIARHPG